MKRAGITYRSCTIDRPKRAGKHDYNIWLALVSRVIFLVQFAKHLQVAEWIYQTFRFQKQFFEAFLLVSHNTKSSNAEIVIIQVYVNNNSYTGFASEKAISGVDTLPDVVTSAFRHNRVMTSTMAPRQINESRPNLIHAWGEHQILQVITATR